MNHLADRSDIRSVQLTCRRLTETALLPERAHDDDAGLDLFADVSVTIPAGGRAAISTGVAVAIPQGMVGLVCPRSGLARSHGIALVNAPGVIDAGYRGELSVLLLNTDQTRDFSVERGMRIAQLLIQPIALGGVREVSTLPEAGSARGTDGFGSTGA